MLGIGPYITSVAAVLRRGVSILIPGTQGRAGASGGVGAAVGAGSSFAAALSALAGIGAASAVGRSFFAGVGASSGAGAAPAVSPATFDITYNGDVASAGPITGPQTFSSVPFGTAAAGRVVALIVSSYIQDQVEISGITIGGVAAERQVWRNFVPDPTNAMEIWSAVVPTGTTGNVVISGATGSVNFYQIFPYSIYGAGGATAFDTGSAPVANPLQDSGFTAPGPGAAISFATIYANTSPLDWGAATQTFYDTPGGTDTVSAAMQLFSSPASAPAMSLSWTPPGGNAFYAIFASWGASVAGASLLLDDGGHLLLSGGGRLLLG